MEAINTDKLTERLSEERRDYWIHIDSDSPLEKYPAKQHALRVAENLGVSEGLIYLPGAPLAYLEDSDQPMPFRQRRYFYYMSGVDESDCHLTYDILSQELVLFIPPIDPKKVIWNGRGSTVAEAYEKYDVDQVLLTTHLTGYINQWLSFHKGSPPIFILHREQGPPLPLLERHPQLDFVTLQKAMNAARVTKDEHEIKLIKKANEISAKAHRTVMSKIGKLKNEAQVEALFLETCIAEDAKHQAYEIIAASGENASTLHYVKNDEPFLDRQMICLDAGCEWDNYASDVTRTFPLSTNGSWPSAEAQNIYALVQSMQERCIEECRPGVRFLDAHFMAHKIAVDGLLELGILHNGTAEEIYKAGTSLAFFPHGLGHHMGLEVHDVADISLMSTAEGYGVLQPYETVLCQPDICRAPVDPRCGGLQEGMVITVEPGIYFSRYALEKLYFTSPVHSKYINKDVLARYMPVGGVRIEDDILITRSGYENLTTAPKGKEMLKILGIIEDAEVPKDRQIRAPSDGSERLAPTPSSRNHFPIICSGANASGDGRHNCAGAIRKSSRSQLPSAAELEYAQGPTLFAGFQSPSSSGA